MVCSKTVRPVKTMKNVFLLLLSVTALLSLHCTATLPKEGFPRTGTYKINLDIRVMGSQRYYLVHIPNHYDFGEKAPLVLVLHGAFSTPKQIEEQSGFSELADQEGFLVAYPSGAYGVFGYFKHWNAGHCCGKAAGDGLDDVGFLVDVIEDIADQFNVDRTRIYMVGFSNGGMLTYRFAAEHTHVLAAAAPLAAAIGGKASFDSPLWIIPDPVAPLPMIVFHARDDLTVPYRGGISPRKGGEREYLSVDEAVDFWVRNNGCRAEPTIDRLHDGIVTRKTWPDTHGYDDVILYTIDNWGHQWPGRYFSKDLEKNHSFREFDAADIIWEFFKQHSK